MQFNYSKDLNIQRSTAEKRTCKMLIGAVLAVIKGLIPVASSVHLLYFSIGIIVYWYCEQYMNMNIQKDPQEMSSLSTLGNSIDHSQSTKKSITTDDVSIDSSHPLSRIAPHQSIIVPFNVNIRSLIKHLLLKLEEKGIVILHSDESQGQILIQKQANSTCWRSLLDCLCICKKEGWPQGKINQSFEAISILIKKEYIEYRCCLRIRTNCPKQKSSQNLQKFVEWTLDFIKKCLESFKDTQDDNFQMQVNEQSPLAMQKSAYERAYQLFISNSNSDKRYRTLYHTALEKIKEQINIFKQQNGMIESSPKKSPKNKVKQEKDEISQLSSSNSGFAKPRSIQQRNVRKTKIPDILQKIVMQTNILYQFCRQHNQVAAPTFHPDYALFSIEALFSYELLPVIFDLYKRQLSDQCSKFYDNSVFINKNISTKQYFDSLQVRPKFRLPSSSEPYDLAINALRQLETSLTLRQFLLCMQKTFSLIKVCCLYEHDGKLDITSMDDILPVMIYVVARAQVVDFPVYVRIIDEYVKIRGVFELEQRIITTLFVAAEDISKRPPKIGKE